MVDCLAILPTEADVSVEFVAHLLMYIRSEVTLCVVEGFLTREAMIVLRKFNIASTSTPPFLVSP